ncbi:MAG: CPBP family intramembrane metalloprotease [Candidatus Omnitrophica bacterium]|nr:CPBP family intramembrane metalloprotease [Candidatus Omnitrophota bacterium]
MLSFVVMVHAWVIVEQSLPKLEKNKKQVQAVVEQDAKKHEEIIEDKEVIQRIFSKQGIHLRLIKIVGILATLVFALGLFVDIHLLMAKIKGRAIFKSITEHPRVDWDVLDIFRLIIIFLFLGYVIQIADSKLIPRIFPKISVKEFSSVLKTGVLDVLILGLIIYFVKIKYRQGLSALGLKIKNLAKNVYIAVLTYIAFVPVLVVLMLFLVWISTIFDYTPPQEVMFKLFFREKRIWLLITGMVLAVVIGPIVEEVFFRGFSYNAIKKRWGKHSAALLTAVVFAMLHTNLIGFLPIMALGLLLAYIYEITGSLIPSITIHILHNSLMIGLLLFGRYLLKIAG